MPEPQTEDHPIEIRVQRIRKGWVTSVYGLNPAINFKRVMAEFKVAYGCNGSLQAKEGKGMVILFQGDMAVNLRTFLTTQRIATSEALKVVGN